MSASTVPTPPAPHPVIRHPVVPPAARRLPIASANTFVSPLQQPGYFSAQSRLPSLASNAGALSLRCTVELHTIFVLLSAPIIFGLHLCQRCVFGKSAPKGPLCCLKVPQSAAAQIVRRFLIPDAGRAVNSTARGSGVASFAVNHRPSKIMLVFAQRFR
mmetsp:Transcript_27882/g.63370  ORF Transcript_27882/g.63370 Transcript_27882/m.63370 type:complete len:159 (+) Transcript_27882:662-1138(+)